MQQRESFKSTALMHISTQLTLSSPHAAVLIGHSITTPASIFFFAIFRLRPQWDWNALPQPYLASPRLSLDTDALNTYFSDDSSIKVCEPTRDEDMGMGNQQVQAQEDDNADLDFHSGKLSMRKVSTL